MKRNTNDVHELFEQIALSISEKLQVQGIEEEAAEAAAWEAADMVKREWGGEQIYIPKGTAQEVYALHQEIYDRWNARLEDPKDLAREYKRALPALYAILRRVRKRRKAAQPTLFDLTQIDREIPSGKA